MQITWQRLLAALGFIIVGLQWALPEMKWLSVFPFLVGIAVVLGGESLDRWAVTFEFRQIARSVERWLPRIGAILSLSAAWWIGQQPSFTPVLLFFWVVSWTCVAISLWFSSPKVRLQPINPNNSRDLATLGNSLLDLERRINAAVTAMGPNYGLPPRGEDISQEGWHARLEADRDAARTIDRNFGAEISYAHAQLRTLQIRTPIHPHINATSHIAAAARYLGVVGRMLVERNLANARSLSDNDIWRML